MTDLFTDCLIIQDLGRIPYEFGLLRMHSFTNKRTADTVDQFWIVEHDPVYTLGRSGRSEHLLDPGTIPVIQSDRGGQVTYHGPGQLVIYLMLDLARRQLGVRDLVDRIEAAILTLLGEYGIGGHTLRQARGVYVENRKIAALGLRVRRGCCLHGLSLNIDMDLQPFRGINPCGFAGMEVTQLRAFGVTEDRDKVAEKLCATLVDHLGYGQVERRVAIAED